MSAGFRLWQLATNTFPHVNQRWFTHLTTFCLKRPLHTQQEQSVLGRGGDKFPNFSVAVELIQVFRIQCRGYAS